MSRLWDPALEEFLEEQRKVAAAPMPPRGAPPPLPEGISARDIMLGDLRVHVLSPKAPRGVMLHAHPGGFIAGAPEMSQAENARLAGALNVVVASVAYRLAPQHPHPAPLDDCERAALWLLDEGERELGASLMLVGGESAGANLAARLLLRLKRRGALAAVKGANLIVGNYDIAGTPSQRLAPDHYFLSPERLRGSREAAFPGRDAEALRDPEISPLYADLAGMPPAIFTIGAQDSVLDDSLFMAMRWRAAGVSAELAVYPEATHIFMGQPTRMAAEAKRRITDFLQARLDGKSR
ncbi:MAG: alpha/beta hydrolase fold domain-containing protein [Hyphomonadaceae bacterium]|nr:alpha/beta hydrolase fold domain-containing protein [Hyphomonadaceae bacterium]